MELPRLRFRHAAYLVQSIESRFYSVGEGNQFAALAELTYQLRLPVITIALWMQTFLAFEHQTPSFLVRNGIDKSIHRLDGPALAPREPGRQRVLIEGPVEAPMKGVDRAISVARAADASEVWLLTSSDVDSHDGCDRVISRIPAVDTPAVYRSCDVLLKLSNVEGMYGPPLEMFHAGGTVVTNDVTGSDEYLNSGVNGIVVPTDDDRATVEAIVSLRDPHLLARLQRGARDTAAGWPDWSHSSGEFLRVVNSIVRQDPPANLVQMMLMASGARALHETVTGL